MTVATPAGAQTLTTLATFDGSNGRAPSAGLMQGLDGNLYGTTMQGGSPDAHGTVFSLTPEGVLTTLFNFCAPEGCKYTRQQPPGPVSFRLLEECFTGQLKVEPTARALSSRLLPRAAKPAV